MCFHFFVYFMLALPKPQTGFVGRDLEGSACSFVPQRFRDDPNLLVGNSYYEKSNPLKSAGKVIPHQDS